MSSPIYFYSWYITILLKNLKNSLTMFFFFLKHQQNLFWNGLNLNVLLVLWHNMSNFLKTLLFSPVEKDWDSPELFYFFHCRLFILSFLKPMTWSLYTASALLGMGGAGMDIGAKYTMCCTRIISISFLLLWEMYVHVCVWGWGLMEWSVNSSLYNLNLLSMYSLDEGRKTTTTTKACLSWLMTNIHTNS